MRTIINYVKEIDRIIAQLRRGMAHTHSYSVDVLRSTVDELEAIRDTIMSSELQSGENLDALLQKIRDCVRECLHPTYNGATQVLPRPEPDPWNPVVEVPGVNLIMVIDASHTMRPHLNVGKRVYNLLVQFANSISATAVSASIPATVSLVWYGDPTTKSNTYKNSKHPNGFWHIDMNKGAVTDFPARISRQFPVNMWDLGKDKPESGYTAIYESIAQVYDPNVENTLILVSDDWNKIHGSNKSSTYGFTEVKLQPLIDLCDNLGIKNRYGLLPSGRTSNAPGFFRQTKNFNASPMNLSMVQDWIDWTLRPSTAPTT